MHSDAEMGNRLATLLVVVRGPFLCLCFGLVALGCHERADESARLDASIPGETAIPGAAGEPESEAEPSRAPVAGPAGLLVWESNRSGAWRIWARALEGSEPQQLTPDERGRRHCCPHLSPDGEWVAYLSLPEGKPKYSAGRVSGPLRLVRPDASDERELAPAARTYFEHRAAVWRSENELIYIDGDGRTVMVDVESNAVEPLTSEPVDEYGYLVDSRLAWATDGRAGFSTYRSADKRIIDLHENRGCQPYFSHDGRWGFWMAGAGGPISRFDLASGRASPILHKNDERMPNGLGYLYFPMLSRDGSMLAFAASRDEHDHFRSDYELFVAEVDADLELIGEPVRMTHDPSTDRYPDVWVRPLPLGRFVGEAPLTVELEAPDAGDWEWQIGEAAEPPGRTARHLFERPGRYDLVARRGEREVRGLAVIAEAQPPRQTGSAVFESGRVVEVTFDEPLGGPMPSATLDSGVAVAQTTRVDDGRTLRLELERPLLGGDTLRLEGVVDRAEVPNRAERLEIEIAPPLWPSDRRQLAFLWTHGAAPNLVFDPELDADRASSVTPQGRAVLDHYFRMRLGRGTFIAGERDADAVLRAARGSNRLSLEATVRPGRSGLLVGMGGLHLNFALRAEAGRLRISLRTGNRGPGAFQSAQVARYEPGETLHLVVTYAPGRLAAYVDGKPVGEWPIAGDFFHWKRFPLAFGEGVEVGAGESATIEGVAIYGRILEPTEVKENFERFGALRDRRTVVPSLVIEAERVAITRAPQLAEISPYTEALVVDEWRVQEIVEGDSPGELVRVARWAILDGEREASEGVGERRRLTLERFDLNAQLEGVFLADDLEGRGPLFYLVD